MHTGLQVAESPSMTSARNRGDLTELMVTYNAMIQLWEQDKLPPAKIAELREAMLVARQAGTMDAALAELRRQFGNQ